MRILFIFTGGTIGSTLIGDVISVDCAKSYRIIEAYRARYEIGFDYDMTEPYTALSENNTGDTIRELCRCVKGHIKDGYDGIIVTHGTDTLQYSAAALGYTLGLDTIPVCVVSSNRPIEDERANALDNLHAAISFIRGGYGRGCFVCYKNDGSGVTHVHRATRMIGAKSYSDEVSSIYGSVYGSFDGNFVYTGNREYSECGDECAPLCIECLSESSKGILMMSAYPGMAYPDVSENVRYIILTGYHSGTLDTASERARNFYLECKSRGVRVLAAGVSGGPDYASASEFESLGIIPAHNISPVALYVKLWLCDCAGLGASVLSSSLSGEVIK